MLYLVSILSFLSFLFPDSVLSERYTTLSELEEKINMWSEEFSQNEDPYPNASNEGVIFHHEIIGYTGVDQFPIWAIKLSFNANVDEDEPKVLILGQCHAEEIYGLEIAVELIEWLLNPHDEGNSTYWQSIYSIMSESEIWVIPTHNPEGLNVVHGWIDDLNQFQQDESFRKNKYDANNNGIFDFVYGLGDDIDGVDLNRNYDFNWIFGDEFEQTDTGCSGNPSYLSNYDYYRGPQPFSEPEIEAIKNFTEENNFLLSIAYHSSRSGCVSEKVISPWLWDGDKGAPDLPVISRLGEEIASKTPSWDGLGFYYPANSTSRRGNAHDWLYSQTGCIQYLIEVGTSDMQSDDVELIDDTIFNNMQGLMHLLKRAAGTTIQNGPDAYQITGLVTDSYGEPVHAEIKILEFDGPMLQPRYTDSFGRFTRLLIEGTYTLEVLADGFEPYTYQFVPSSSVPTIHDVTLMSLPEYLVDFEFTFPDNFNEPIIATLENDFKVDTLYTSYDYTSADSFEEISQINLEGISIPSGEYRLKIKSPNIFPEIIDLNIHEDILVTVDVKWKGVVFTDDFIDLNKWNNQGEWVIEEIDYSEFSEDDNYDDFDDYSGDDAFDDYFIELIYNNNYLKSQNSDFYENNVYSLLTSMNSFSDIYNNTGKYALQTSLWYELEWDNDFMSIYLSCEGCENDTLGVISGHSLYRTARFSDPSGITLAPVMTYSRHVFPVNLNETSSTINILFSTDETLDYRGVLMNDFNMLFKPDDECFKGDISLDGAIDVNDIVMMVNIIFEDYGNEFYAAPHSNIIFCTSDMNSNGITNINDIVILVEDILYN